MTNNKNCDDINFELDGSYLVPYNGETPLEPVDLTPAIAAAETTTRLQLDVAKSTLVYSNESAVNGTGIADVISIAEIAATLTIQNLGDVSYQYANTGDLLSFDGPSQKWGAYTIPAGTVVSGVGVNAKGQLVKGSDNTAATGASAIPIGGTILWSGLLKTIPSGFLPEDGREISRSIYATLFNTIGTIWGSGDGRTTFNIPNSIERTSVGVGGTTEFSAVGNSAGEKQHVLSFSEMPQHNHPVNDPGHNHGNNTDVAYTTNGNQKLQINGGGQAFGYRSGINNPSGTGISLGLQGDNQPHNNIQPSIARYYIIRAI